ncbi:hypothetical protein [Halosimplex marinum]|uniref:hypothetical protein n=1 Tax=Halosimplex marinum TaxID=3396620 RepID=UPI003F5775AE
MSVGDRIRLLPLKAGAVVGAGVGCCVLVLALLVTVAYPPQGILQLFSEMGIPILTRQPFSETEVAILTLFELQFVGIHSESGSVVLTTVLFEHFEEFRPPNSVLGLLYVVPILLLYRGGKLLGQRYANSGNSLLQWGLTGATVAVGYFAVMGVTTLLVPADPLSVDTNSALVRTGIVYPVAFGAVGGLVAAGYQRGELRVGQLYALAVGLLSAVLVFLSTYVTIEEIPEGAEELLGRAITTTFALHGAFTLDLGASGLGAVPYLVLGVLFAGAGFLLVDRDAGVDTAGDAFVRGAALAPTHVVVASVFFTVASLFASPYLVVEAIPDAYPVVSAATESDALGVVLSNTRARPIIPPFTGVGEFVEDLFLSTVAYPVVLGGSGGLLALRNETRDTAPEYRQQSQTR